MYYCRVGEELCWCYAFIGEKLRVRVDSLPSPPGSPLECSEEYNGLEVQRTTSTPSALAPDAFATPQKEASSQVAPRQITFSATQFDEETSDDEDSLDRDIKEFLVGDSISILKEGTVVMTQVIGRIVGKASKKVRKYVTTGHGTVAAIEVVRESEVVDESPNFLSDEEDAEAADGRNPSAVFATATSVTGVNEGFTIELSEQKSAPMSVLWKLFNNPKYRGGFLARSLFCEAAKEKDTKVLPSPWTGGTSLKATNNDKKMQEQEWLGWTENAVVNEWVRKRVFSIIVANPRPGLTVTWKGRSTQMAIHGVASIVVTESHRCRIAHLASDPKAKLLISLIYGPKADRSDVEDHDLRVTQLWTEVASEFVNAASWTPYADMALQIYSDIDVTMCPAPPGLDAATIKEIWMTLRTDWSRIQVAINSKTGASVLATGSVYDNVWNHFINGQKMVFAHKISAMYCFELWDVTNRQSGLPQWCNRTLPAGSGVSAGVEIGDSSMSSISSTPKSKSGTHVKEKGETTHVDSAARLCSLVETLVQSSNIAGSAVRKFEVLGAELRALQTAHDLTPDGDPMKPEIIERIRTCTRQLLSSRSSPLSPA
jgi:hypothetical protein